MSLITGKVINGKFVPDSPELFKLAFERKEGKHVKIELSAIGEKVKKYAYLYGVVYKTYKEEIGYDTLDEVDRDLKSMFLVDHAHENKITGEIESKILRKRDVSPERLSEYVTECVRYGNTFHGFNLLTSEEYYEAKV